MPVPSRPSFRSSACRGADPESPATDNGRQHSHPPQGKRTRDSSLGNDSNASNKRLKSETRRFIRNTSIGPKRQALKSLPFRDRDPAHKQAVTQVVKSRSVDPVLVQPPTHGATPLDAASGGVVHNGINQNVSTTVEQMDKRSLRSHDGASRSKSELEPYFSNYEELITIIPKNPNTLTPETILHIYDEPTKSASTTSTPSSNRDKVNGVSPDHHGQNSDALSHTPIDWPDKAFTTLNNAIRIDLPTFEHRGRKSMKDPLDDSIYTKLHAREERKEKQLRNIEKERAMHEKFQLERLLDGLKGHDWLRVMGISGITDTEKKLYEPKRDHLIYEVRALLEKFRLWKEEEKRRKAEKDGSQDDDDQEDNEDDEEEGHIEQATDDQADSVASDDGVSDGDPPDYSDVDASAARQLHMEAVMATKKQKTITPSVTTSQAPSQKLKLVMKPFKSFYAKPYMRAAAIGKHRRSGRSMTAFGQSMPDVPEKEFELPPDIKTAEAVPESERQLRRRKRDSEDP